MINDLKHFNLVLLRFKVQFRMLKLHSIYSSYILHLLVNYLMIDCYIYR